MSYADVNGLSLYYEEHGAGDPLVLLHGGFGAGELPGPLTAALAAGRRVIRSTSRAMATRATSTGRCAPSTWPTTSRR